MQQDCTSLQRTRPAPEHSVSTAYAHLPAQHMRTMLRCVRALYRLTRNSLYQQHVAGLCLESGRFNPGHDAVMMGYDFHLTAEGPRLIEVNTNAGGGLLPWLRPDLGTPSEKTRALLLSTFIKEYQLFTGKNTLPLTLVILDEKPEEQFLYPEMVCFANLFKQRGIVTCILDPGDLQASDQGVFHNNTRVDVIYNRHTDFYLDAPAMAGLRRAWLAGQVCLTPNPHAYALLADKRRLALWSDEDSLERFQVSPRDRRTLLQNVPESHVMSDLDTGQLWQNRDHWVLKPLNKFGSRGVILGKKISRRRFDEFEPEQTLAQRYIPPSLTQTQTDDTLKTDFRLFVYQNKVLGILARLFQGQVTNMRTPGGGFARVRIGHG